MPVDLHLVPRPDSAEPLALARELASSPFVGPDANPARVLEIFDARLAGAAVDLSLDERDWPEVVAILHDVARVHLHGIHPRVAMRALPEVRDNVLQRVPLVVHGPVVVTGGGEADNDRAWPGPVHADQTAHDELPDAQLVPTTIWIDSNDADLLPRACGSTPLIMDDGSALAVVGLSHHLPETTRAQLRFAIESLARPALRVEVADETELRPFARAQRRRAMQAMIFGEESRGGSRELLEAAAQGLPIIVLGDAAADGPPGIVYAGGRHEIDRCVACLRSWANSWVQGHAPEIDQNARLRWLGERLAKGAA